MFNWLFTNMFENGFSFAPFMYCSLASLIIGAVIVLTANIRDRFSPGYIMTLGILPMIVQVIIMLVNGNIGVGVAIAGAFSLVRFRSAQGTAKEIVMIFLAMAAGLACGMGYIGVAALLTVIAIPVIVLYSLIFKQTREKQLDITIPESLDYSDVFDDLFKKYAKHYELISVKTTNMGSLFRLKYTIVFKDNAKEKEFIDQLRCRNGNLEILCRTAPDKNTEL